MFHRNDGPNQGSQKAGTTIIWRIKRMTNQNNQSGHNNQNQKHQNQQLRQQGQQDSDTKRIQKGSQPRDQKNKQR